MSFTKLNPTRSMYLRGFDRRGCSASLNNASEEGFQVSGIFSDQADFAVLMLFDADDLYGHLTTSKYLPNFSLRNVVLDFDLTTNGCFNPTSPKFESVPWKSLSYIFPNGNSGTVEFPTSTVNSGGAAASITYTLSGTPTTFDRIQIVYLSNIIIDSANFGITTGQTLAQVATAMVALVNSITYTPQVPLTAVVDPEDLNSFIISYSAIGIDGNNNALVCMLKSGSVISITNQGQKYLTGGTAPDSIHLSFDFTALNLDDVRQLWFTIAPALPLGNSTTFTPLEFNWTASNWTIKDPSNQLPLKISGLLSTTIPHNSPAVIYSGTWAIESGFYYHGFATAATHTGSSATISYTNNRLHDLYLGTVLNNGNGSFLIMVDGVSYGSIVTNLNVAAQLNTRRLLVENVAAGSHVLTLVTTSGSPCYIDYIQAVVASDPAPPLQTYQNVGPALDFDTDQTYKISPERAIFIINQLGLRGNIDFYKGVFFSEVRIRNGGLFNSAVVSFNGTWGTGTGFGDGAQLFIDLSGTSFGVSVYPSDTNITIAERFADFTNAGFVGVRAVVSGDTTTAILTITELTPINFFTVAISTSTSSGGTMQLNSVTAPASDVIKAGNEGTWAIATTNPADLQNFPLNKAFMDYIKDFDVVTASNGLSYTLAFSQELLQPPDVNTANGAWSQRYSDGTPVLTDTAFGSWGTGYVQSFSVSGGVTTIVSNGHGYITGNTVQIWSVATPFDPPPVAQLYSGIVTVIDANTFSIHATPTIVVGDQIFINLLTSQCTFNPNTVTPYMASCYKQVALYTDRIQFGEILWWFFAGGTGPSMAYYDAYTSSIATAVLGRSLSNFSGPTSDPSVNSYADTNLLRSLLVAHIHTIRTAVLGLNLPRALQFEWLLPFDVNWPTQYTNVQFPFNIGGPMNYYVNIPPRYLSPDDDIDLIKMEALAWGTSYRTLDNANTSVNFPFTVGVWPKDRLGYLVPVQNGGCPWIQELQLAINSGVALINFWAIDHIILLSWDFPIPMLASYKQRKPFFLALTTTISYLRTWLNDLITTPPPNNGGAPGGIQ
jgi:hypothetical protein